MESEIQKRIVKNGLIISRLPSWARELIIGRAKEEFCDDYGMCISAVLKESLEYNQLKQMFFDNELNIKLGIGNEQTEEIEKKIHFANGTKLMEAKK
ncbi:MAG: hypothetical protein ACTSU7_00250 [Candidatus Heimdallarchaeaceae archaeon]